MDSPGFAAGLTLVAVSIAIIAGLRATWSP